MGSGKSSVGRILARKKRWKFLDTDHLIIEQAEGMEISRIFAEFGEENFRDRETAVLRSLIGSKKNIIATGGGIILREENRQLLRQLGFVVWLTASEEVLFNRVSRNDKRPLLQTPNPRETIHQILETRTSLYQESADCVIDSTHLSCSGVTDLILLRARQYFSHQH